MKFDQLAHVNLAGVKAGLLINPDVATMPLEDRPKLLVLTSEDSDDWGGKNRGTRWVPGHRAWRACGGAEGMDGGRGSPVGFPDPVCLRSGGGEEFIHPAWDLPGGGAGAVGFEAG